jgi:hypothetical protein
VVLEEVSRAAVYGHVRDVLPTTGSNIGLEKNSLMEKVLEVV